MRSNTPANLRSLGLRTLAPILLIIWAAAAQNMEVTGLTGTAKIQRSGRKSWETLKSGDDIRDNDIVETFFQTQLMLEYEDNLVIVGSNSKALMNLSKERNDPKVHFRTTLFSGGLFAKPVYNTTAAIFTSHGVAELDSGSISAVVDPKSGFTGFQVLGGSARVRNVAQQDGRKLTAGQTTVVRPGKKPTTALYITEKHVNVLKSFFGHSHVDHEMKLSNINPTQGGTATKRLNVSKDVLSTESREPMRDWGKYKPLFDVNQIYDAILEEQVKDGRRYAPITEPGVLFEKNQGVLGVNASFASTNGRIYPRIGLLPSVRFLFLDIGLDIGISQKYDGTMSMDFGSLSAILDKIDHFTVGIPEKKKYIRLGSIENLTIADGLMVDRFSNANPYSVYKAKGITGRFTWGILDLHGFIADAASFDIGGGMLSLHGAAQTLGLGYYYDLDQTAPLPTSESPRFVDLPPASEQGVHSDSLSVSPGNVHAYEIHINSEIYNNLQLRILANVSFAQKIFAGKSDGMAAKPHFSVEWRKFRVGGGMTVETGRLLSSQFHSFYMTNRRRYVPSDSTGGPVVTQNGLLSDQRTAPGVFVDFGAAFFNGTAVDLHLKHDFGSDHPLKRFDDDSSKGRNNFSYRLSVAAGRNFYNLFNFAELYLQQYHGGYYPAGVEAGEGATYFASWGFETGLDIISRPLFANVALQGGFNFRYLDLDPDLSDSRRFNNNIDRDDRVTEFYIGALWGFL